MNMVNIVKYAGIKLKVGIIVFVILLLPIFNYAENDTIKKDCNISLTSNKIIIKNHLEIINFNITNNENFTYNINFIYDNKSISLHNPNITESIFKNNTYNFIINSKINPTKNYTSIILRSDLCNDIIIKVSINRNESKLNETENYNWNNFLNKELFKIILRKHIIKIKVYYLISLILIFIIIKIITKNAIK